MNVLVIKRVYSFISKRGKESEDHREFGALAEERQELTMTQLAITTHFFGYFMTKMCFEKIVRANEPTRVISSASDLINERPVLADLKRRRK